MQFEKSRKKRQKAAESRKFLFFEELLLRSLQNSSNKLWPEYLILDRVAFFSELPGLV